MATTLQVHDLDPFSPDFLHDPYPGHEALREAGPVVRLERYGIWGVGLADLREEEAWRRPSLLLEADPPEHSRARRVVAGVLSAAAVRRLHQTAAGVAEEMVVRLPQDEPFDAMAELARAFPVRVFSDAVGLPREGRENLHAYARMVFDAKGPRQPADGLGNSLFLDAMAQLGSSREWAEEHCRAEHLTPDGLGSQIHERAAAEGFSADEAGMLVRSFLSAGIDTTVHALGNALWCLSRHPDQFSAMRSTPDGARAAFEEALRFESAEQMIFRTTTRKVELDGVTLSEGEKIMLFLAGANRDSRQWPDPDVFDISRRATGHLTFGFGIHVCLGMAFARMEGEAARSGLRRTRWLRPEATHASGRPRLATP